MIDCTLPGFETTETTRDGFAIRVAFDEDFDEWVGTVARDGAELHRVTTRWMSWALASAVDFVDSQMGRA